MAGTTYAVVYRVGDELRDEIVEAASLTGALHLLLQRRGALGYVLAGRIPAPGDPVLTPADVVAAAELGPEPVAELAGIYAREKRDGR